ncbi:MAG: hypothetical protein ACP5G4_04685, partial [bacterium]
MRKFAIITILLISAIIAESPYPTVYGEAEFFALDVISAPEPIEQWLQFSGAIATGTVRAEIEDMTAFALL